jgi:hypothetical protein
MQEERKHERSGGEVKGRETRGGHELTILLAGGDGFVEYF